MNIIHWILKKLNLKINEKLKMDWVYPKIPDDLDSWTLDQTINEHKPEIT